MTRALVVIPARGGSRGVPGKNVASVGGVPLVVRAARAALASRLASSVVVSTDDDAIAAVAATVAGVLVVRRPAELATSTSSSESALVHAIEHVTAGDGRRPDVVALVQCTSPFVSVRDVDGVLGAVVEDGFDSAATVSAAHGFLWQVGADGAGVPVNHEGASRARRQDREPEYVETGAAYAVRVDALLASGHRFAGRFAPVVVDAARTLEVDEPADLGRARALADLLDGPGAGRLPGRDDVDAVVMDFDGTLTDDRAWIDADGRESVAVHRGDGLGTAALRRAGYRLLILSTETNRVVQLRAEKLRVPCLHGISAKGIALAGWCADEGLDPSRVLYVGNDTNDLPCFDLVGWPVAVADAHSAVRARARAVTTQSGGRGAIREIAAWLLGQELDHDRSSPGRHDRRPDPVAALR